jgi:hypothetical protein
MVYWSSAPFAKFYPMDAASEMRQALKHPNPAFVGRYSDRAQCSTTPSLHNSNTPPLHYSDTPILQYSITPPLHPSITPRAQRLALDYLHRG